MDSCTFCKIVNREIPAYIIRETDSVISFLSLENHPLVVPKVHIANIYALDSENGQKVMDEIVTIAKAMKQGVKADGIYLTQANEPAAGQDVFHIHFHLYLRWENKDINERMVSKDGLLANIRGAPVTPCHTSVARRLIAWRCCPACGAKPGIAYISN